jgi:hypothetical protein
MSIPNFSRSDPLFFEGCNLSDWPLLVNKIQSLSQIIGGIAEKRFLRLKFLCVLSLLLFHGRRLFSTNVVEDWDKFEVSGIKKRVELPKNNFDKESCSEYSMESCMRNVDQTGSLNLNICLITSNYPYCSQMQF